MATGIPITVDELIDTPTINSWARGYARTSTPVTVNSTTTATTLFTTTLPAGALATDKILRMTAWGDWKQNSGGANDLPQFVVSLGGTLMFVTGNTGTNVAGDAVNRYGWRIVCEIQNLGSAASQWSNLFGVIAYNGAAAGGSGFVTGNGATIGDANGNGRYEGGNATTVNTAASCALLLQIQNSSSSATYETKFYGALVEII